MLGHTPAQDPGSADPRLARALEARGRHGRDAAVRSEVLAALVDARVFAAIAATATAEHVEPGSGLRAESSAELAVLLLEAADGSRALPVFSDLAALASWRPDARPVPLTGAQACAAALDERATTVLLNPGGTGLGVAEDELRQLALRHVPVAGARVSTRRADTVLGDLEAPAPAALVAALRVALAPERLAAARLLQGPEGLVLGVCPPRALDPPALTALAARVRGRLGADLPADGLDLAQVGPEGAGTDLLASGRSRTRGRTIGWFRRGR